MTHSKFSQPSSEILVSLTTIPLLLVLVGSRALAEAVQNLGQASEEIFRGDRLPVLPVSEFDASNSPAGENR